MIKVATRMEGSSKEPSVLLHGNNDSISSTSILQGSAAVNKRHVNMKRMNVAVKEHGVATGDSLTPTLC